MISSNSANESLKEYCKHNVKCEKAAASHCQSCGQKYCMEHYSKHQRKLQKQFEHIYHMQDFLNQELESLISELSTDVNSNLLQQIHEFKMKSDEIQDSKKPLITMTNDYLENYIQCLKTDIEWLKLKLKEINNYRQKKVSQEHDINIQSANLPEQTNHLQSVVNTSAVSHLIFKQVSPSIIDFNESELDPSEGEDETYAEEEEMVEIIDSNTTPKISRKIHLSNNAINHLRGPFKLVIDAPVHAAELFTRKAHASDAVVQAVRRGLTRQNQTNNSLEPVFIEITLDWTFESKNADRGFCSESIWMRNPEGRRILVKTQDHPLSAANEWLAYALGKQLDLPVNEVQIAIYKNNLVSLHADVAHEHENTSTFIDLPKQIRKSLLTHPIMECMDLFDHIIQNVDRNPRNILITTPKTTVIDDTIGKMAVHLIDHSACFGIGKLNIVGVMASKFHSQHLAVVKFNAIDKARKFEEYLCKVPTKDRILIRKTLNRFAAITDDQFDSWMIEVQDLLSSDQYNRIRDVLYRQRDIVKRYTIRWGISPRSSSIKPHELTFTNE